jgi:molybdopterin synthase catalytic subunit
MMHRSPLTVHFHYSHLDTNMNKIAVLFFATLKDLAGERRVVLDIEDGLRVADLRSLLAVRYPRLAQAIGSALVSINREFAFDEDIVPSGAEVALFPPVSGG